MKFMIMPVPNQFKGYAGGQTVIQWPLSTKNAKTAHNLQVHLWWKEQKRTPSNICSEKLWEMLAQTWKSKQLAYIGNNINWTVSEVWALNKDDSHDQTSWSVSDKKQRPLHAKSQNCTPPSKKSLRSTLDLWWMELKRTPSNSALEK